MVNTCGPNAQFPAVDSCLEAQRAGPAACFSWQGYHLHIPSPCLALRTAQHHGPKLLPLTCLCPGHTTKTWPNALWYHKIFYPEGPFPLTCAENSPSQAQALHAIAPQLSSPHCSQCCWKGCLLPLLLPSSSSCNCSTSEQTTSFLLLPIPDPSRTFRPQQN